MDWEKRCHELQRRIDELEEENRKLRLQLGLPTIDVVAESALPYGGINYLGFEKATNGAMRLYSEDLAQELMDTVYSDHGDAQTAILGF